MAHYHYIEREGRIGPLYTFAAGEGLPMHAHANAEELHEIEVIEGCVEIETPRSVRRLEGCAGVLDVDTSAPHAVRALTSASVFNPWKKPGDAQRALLGIEGEL